VGRTTGTGARSHAWSSGGPDRKKEQLSRRLLIVLSVLAIVFSLPASAAGASTSPNGLNNRAHAHTNQRHPADTQFAWAVAEVDRPSVTAQNTALATAHHCDGCQTTAVAFQIVVASDTNIFVLTNTAVAANFNCETCTSVAIAEQWVVGDTSEKLTITPAGQAALQGVQSQVGALLGTPLQLDAELPAIEAEVDGILSADIVVVPPPVKKPVTPLTLAAPAPAPPIIQHYEQVSTG
jgi:hypothetical protein